MKIYFVRHGETYHNVNNLYSKPEYELTENGIKQAEVAGGRLSSLAIEVLVVSPYKRTVQTAEEINKTLSKEIILTELAKEIVRPSEIAGTPLDNPNSRRIMDLVHEKASIADFHYSDEENYYDLMIRAKELLKFLEDMEGKYQTIAVITHGVLIKMLLMVTILEDDFKPENFVNAYKNLTLSNSGLTVFEKNQKGWKVITVNDQSHLGD